MTFNFLDLVTYLLKRMNDQISKQENWKLFQLMLMHFYLKLYCINAMWTSSIFTIKSLWLPSTVWEKWDLGLKETRSLHCENKRLLKSKCNSIKLLLREFRLFRKLKKMLSDMKILMKLNDWRKLLSDWEVLEFIWLN